MTVWKPTKEELKLIRECAKSETGLGRIELQPGIRCNFSVEDKPESMNIACVSDEEDWSEDTELQDFSDWNTFKKGVELSEKGVAIIDFYCYSRNGLESNIVVYYQEGSIFSIQGVLSVKYSRK